MSVSHEGDFICAKAILLTTIASMAQRQHNISLASTMLYLNVVLSSAHRLAVIKPRDNVIRTQRAFLIGLSGEFRTASTDTLFSCPMYLEG